MAWSSADIAVEQQGAAVIARLTGEVDMTNAAHVGDELTRSVPNEAVMLVIDLSGTRYLDSAAIELLFDLARKLGRRRQQLRLVLPEDSPLRRVLLLTDVESAAGMHETVEEALAGAG